MKMGERSSRVGAARNALLLFPMLCAISFVGCLGRSPEVEHFMLGTAEAADQAAPGVGPGLAVLVGPVRLPAYLGRPQIATLEDGGEVELDEFNRWLGGFEENFLRSIALGLARSLDSIRVAMHPSSAPFAFDYRVQLHIDDLVFVSRRDAVRARIRWALVREASKVPAGLFLMELSVPVGEASTRGRVAAHEVVIAELVSRISSEIQRLEAFPEADEH